ncbi:MAG: hypothetical protein ACHQT6_04735 [Candidatus Acidiferrales bacterium]
MQERHANGVVQRDASWPDCATLACGGVFAGVGAALGWPAANAGEINSVTAKTIPFLK